MTWMHSSGSVRMPGVVVPMPMDFSGWCKGQRLIILAPQTGYPFLLGGLDVCWEYMVGSLELVSAGDLLAAVKYMAESHSFVNVAGGL